MESSKNSSTTSSVSASSFVSIIERFKEVLDELEKLDFDERIIKELFNDNNFASRINSVIKITNDEMEKMVSECKNIDYDYTKDHCPYKNEENLRSVYFQNKTFEDIIAGNYCYEFSIVEDYDAFPQTRYAICDSCIKNFKYWRERLKLEERRYCFELTKQKERCIIS